MVEVLNYSLFLYNENFKGQNFCKKKKKHNKNVPLHVKAHIKPSANWHAQIDMCLKTVRWVETRCMNRVWNLYLVKLYHSF